MVGNTAMLQRAGVTRAPTDVGAVPHGAARGSASSNAVPGGAPACLSLDWARILAFIYQNNGAWLNAARTQSVINSRRERRDADDLPRLDARAASRKTPAQLGVGWCGEALGKEKAAIIFEGNWVYGYMQADFPSVRFTVYPMIRNKPHGNLGVHGLVLDGQGLDEQGRRVAAPPLPGRPERAGGLDDELRLPAVAQRRQGAAPAAPTSSRRLPYARPWQFIKGFDRVNDLAGKELEKAFNGDQTVVQMLQQHRPATEEAIAGVAR